MNGYGSMSSKEHASDEELMRQVTGGSQEAIGLLHQRFARLIFGLAVRTLDRAAAEDIVQEVFLAVWRKAATFDPARGTVRAWVLQIAHFRILNELRRRGRQPEIEPDPEGAVLASLPAQDPGPPEAAWRNHRRRLVASALDELPRPQREAVGLAFLEDLTHEQVAAELRAPLGTTKTRIRAGLQKLRGLLGPVGAALTAFVLLVSLGLAYRSERLTRARDERALTLVTASDAVNLRLAPVPGMPADMHARYRGRPGVGLAVVTFSSFPPAPSGETYRAWVRHGSTWTALGAAVPDADGSARLVVEDPALVAPPDALEVTLEPRAGSAVPGGRLVVGWTP
jgi:RNA polymerase sigma-70 factor (ECF subfamily)